MSQPCHKPVDSIRQQRVPQEAEKGAESVILLVAIACIARITYSRLTSACDVTVLCYDEHVKACIRIE